ncbi:MAG: hypothetical protein A2288_02305 [Candidatus Moranbacteria bacterium RIFOXYA12_FULL_44_15]|nr:MAG: hypothetical protein A2288_02305 [Candidatus Moranbacteria bacterium RIFOXYA12_FULL_44_15]OGI36413.1 MAG: hypothetical protein A2259_03375 [Candidatus Moranbacteria bacterium RIFOXYA2_FULL_43_15]
MKSQPPTNSEKKLNNHKDYGTESPNGFDFANGKLRERIGGGQALKIRENVSLAPYTTFKIGGPAKYFCEVSDEEALVEALNYARDNNLNVFVLGGGSNILVSDEGFDGMAVKLKVKNKKLKVTVQNSKFLVNAWAGESLSSLVNFCRENSLTGMEWASGIPGSIGGAVRGNAGAYGSDMSKTVESVKVLEMTKIQDTRYKQIPNDKNQISNKILKSVQVSDLNRNSSEGSAPKNSAVQVWRLEPTQYLRVIKNKDCEFSYRDSIFKQNPNLIILSVVLRLEKGGKDEIENKIIEIIKKRTEKLPSGFSAGSFFQNPTVNNPDLIKKFERDVGCECRDGKIPAGWLIEEVGMRGKKIGGAMVSEKHCNFVVNLDGATAEDVVMLASFIKTKVRDELGVELKEEVQCVGF